MSEQPLDRQQVARLLADEVSLLDDFIVVLKREESLLLDTKTDALVELAEQKTAVYRRLQFLSDQRSRLFAAARLELNDASMSAALANDATALANWQKLLELAAEAAQRNQINGKLISEKMQHNQQALTVLMAAASQPGATYGPDGQSRPHLSGRRFGSV